MSSSQMAPQQGRPRQEAASSNAQAQDSDEAPPVTAACEQCRSRKVRCDRRIPHCSNCEKAGVVCEFPHRGKRINQVKQLTEIVSGLAARLDSIDGSINNLVQHMSIHSTSSPESTRTPKTSRSSSACLTDLSISDAEDMDMMFYPEQGSGKNLIPGDRGQIDSTQGGACDIVDSGIPWGPIGARALFESSKRALGDLVEKLAKSTSSSDTSDSENNTSLTASNALAKSNPAIESELKTAYGMYPLQNYQEPSIYSDNGQKVASPPRSLLETSIQYFLDEFNIITPIFQESKLRQAIDMHYSVGGSKGDEAWDLCFNNIIVLTLGLKSRLARMNPSFTQGMNDELLPAFLNNSLRAFQHLDSFLQPRLVNVQALATLAMVAREYHENKVFDMICHMASHVVKFMGLQQSTGVKSNMPDLDEERKDLYWALFVMDKQRTYIAGRPFDIHLYDSDIRSMPTATPQCTHQFRTAHIHMMSIWEEIYISLYSLRAFRKGHSYRQSQVTKLDYLSRKWCARNGHLFSELSPDETPIIANWRIELKYCFHVGNVLIHRSCSEVSSQQIETLNSRAALQIIQGVYKMSPTVGSVALLSRLVRNYPLVALHGLFARFLRNPTYESLGDLDLLNSIGEALGATCDPSVPFACLTRIYVGISWYIDIAKVLRTGLENVLETQKSQEAQQPQQQAAKRSQESFPTSPRARRRISVQLSKKAKNSPPAMNENNPNASFPPTTQANQVAPPWFMSESERPAAFENAQFKPQCSSAPANNFANPTLPAFEPYAEPNSFTDDLSQFLHNTMPFTPTLPVQSRPPGQTQVQQQQVQSQFQPPLSPLPSKTSMTSSWLSCMPNGGRDASQCDMRDTSIFDSFLACNSVPESWEADFTDQPMFDDFYRVKPT